MATKNNHGRKLKVYYGRRGQGQLYGTTRKKKAGMRYSPIEWGTTTKHRKELTQ